MKDNISPYFIFNPVGKQWLIIVSSFISLKLLLFGGNFDDALGASKASGEDLGSAEFLDGGTKEAEDYYNNNKEQFTCSNNLFKFLFLFINIS